MADRIEAALLNGTALDGVAPLHEAACRCDVAACLQTDVARQIVGAPDTGELADYLSQLDDRIAEHEGAIDVLCIGATLLRAYLQINYTGPYLEPASYAALPCFDQADVLAALATDGTCPYALVQAPVLLLLAERFLAREDTTLPSGARWRLRCDFVLQQLLDEPCASLHDAVYDAARVEACLRYAASLGRDAAAAWHLELAHVHNFYSHDRLARAEVKRAEAASGLVMRVSGALGRRTKFQTFDVSQLVVLARSRSSDSSPSPERSADQEERRPENLALNDDTILESVRFTPRNAQLLPIIEAESDLPEALRSLDPGRQPTLAPIDACVLLSDAAITRYNSAADDPIVVEQMAAFVARVLQNFGPQHAGAGPSGDEEGASNDQGATRDWTIDSIALLMRTRAEAHRSRTVERSVMQLQVLVDQLVDGMSSPAGSERPSFLHRAGSAPAPVAGTESDALSSASAVQRLRLLFSLPMASKWELQSELADRYVSLGLVKSALEIYERLELWEKAALCHGASGREDLAESLLRARIEAAGASDNVPKLWCLLGDVLKDPACWERAWEVSGRRFARAQRSLGRWHYDRKDLAASVACYRRSLAINPLNHSAWFVLGCASLALGELEDAASAFTRCVSIDNTDGEAWNNLASALLRQGKHRLKDAHAALRHATALKFESWRMWENYALVSLDLGQLGEVVRAQRRVLDIRGNEEAYLDRDVLEALVREILSSPAPELTEGAPNGTTDSSESGGEEAPLRGTTRMIYDFLTRTVRPLVTHDAALWRELARVYLWRGRYASSLECEERSWRVSTATPGIDTEPKVFAAVVEAACELAAAYENLGPRPGRFDTARRDDDDGSDGTDEDGEATQVCKEWRYKARSVLRTLKGRGRVFEGTEAYDKLEEALASLRSA